MDNERLVMLMAQVVQGMGVPVSMGMPLGMADEPLRELMGVVPGWATSTEYEVAFLEILENGNDG